MTKEWRYLDDNMGTGMMSAPALAILLPTVYGNGFIFVPQEGGKMFR
jgi:hypothetical protein